MKYLLLLPLLAFAANPDQDLIVDLVRERFAASKPATLADLQLGKTWTCAIYSGQRGIVPNYNTYKTLFRFEQSTDGKIVNKQDFAFSFFEMSAQGMVSKLEGKTLYTRVASNGALVFENVGKQPKKHKAYRALADNKLRGLDYLYCK